MTFDPIPTPVQCPVCGTPNTVLLHRVIDVQQQPQLKTRLVTHRLNTLSCQNCGQSSSIAGPFIYHDAEKELALVFLPIESGQSNIDQQRLIGQLTQTVMNSLPPKKRKAYLLQPQQFITLQTLIEEVLKADGITAEVMEEQRGQIDLLNRMVNAIDDITLDTIIKENDETIDYAFLQLLSIQMTSAQADQQPAEQTRLVAVYERLLELSSVGKKVKSQSAAIETLTASPTRETLLEQLVQSSDSETRRALLATGRPLLDYPFFQQLTGQIDEAKKSGDSAEADRLTDLRKEILTIRDQLDAQVQQMAEERTVLLNRLMISKELEQEAQDNINALDEVFFDILASNIQRAQQSGDKSTFERLVQVSNITMNVAQQTQPSEIQFVNALIAAEYPDGTRALLEHNKQVLTPEFIEWLDSVAQGLREDGRTESADRLQPAIALAREIVGIAVSK